MEVLSKVISFLLVVILLFLLPVDYLLGHRYIVSDGYTKNETARFVDTVRSQGYLDVGMYEEFLKKLSVTGDLYEIEIEHAVPKEGERLSAFDGLPGVMVASAELQSLPLGTEEGIITTFAAHNHIDDCYEGHNHTVSGCTDGYICHDGSLTLVTRSLVHDKEYNFNCTTCGKTIIAFRVDYFDTNDNYFICTMRWSASQNDYVLTKSNYFIDSDAGADIGYPAARNLIGYASILPRDANTLYRNYPEINFTAKNSYPDTTWVSIVPPPKCQLPNDPNPICDRVITSITATNPSQTISIGQEIITTAIATYLDGHSGIVNCSSNFNPGISGNQIITLTYSGLVGNAKTIGTRTCLLSVTMGGNSPLSYISVEPTMQTIERYTLPSFEVTAFYEDGSFKKITGANISGFDSSRIGVQDVTVSYTENNIIRSTLIQITVTPMKRLCPVCGNEYFLNEEDFDPGCPSCKTIVSYIQVSPEYITINQYEPLNIIVTATFLDGHTETVMGWNSNCDPNRTGMQLVRVSFRGKFTYVSVMVVSVNTCSICGVDYSLNEDGSDPGCPYCKEALVSISAEPTYQLVNQGDDITLTVLGLYRDGHTEEIQGWHYSYDKNIPGEQLVTVYYNDLSCKITVEVMSELDMTCSVCGEVYNLREHPWGCPVCYDTIIGIEASLQSGGTLVPYGEKLDLRVILIYRDGRKTLAFEGWQDDFDPYTMGKQTVTVSISDRFGNQISCMLEVEVTDRLIKMVCENGHEYYSEDSLAGCPYCATGSDSKTEEYYKISFTDEILDTLYTDGIYRFNSGDYITVKVIIRTRRAVLSNNLLHGMKEERKPVIYGGEVA